jgi:peptidylprolyl isomerase
MKQAAYGDLVKVHYVGSLEDGTVFDSSQGGDPIEFVIGDGDLIPGFEDAVVGMTAGQSKREHIPVEKAYGAHRPEMVGQVDRDRFPPEMELSLGRQLVVTHPDGHRSRVTVTEITAGTVTLDANHPLAGKDLVFQIDLVEIGAGSAPLILPG